MALTIDSFPPVTPLHLESECPFPKNFLEIFWYCVLIILVSCIILH